MKIKSLIFFVVSILFFSCNENNEVVPRANPRFSVSLVQSISEEGAEFRAFMIDYGSDEILEYGFVYSTSATPNIGFSEYVSESGVPPEHFSLTASYGLIKGLKY